MARLHSFGLLREVRNGSGNRGVALRASGREIHDLAARGVFKDLHDELDAAVAEASAGHGPWSGTRSCSGWWISTTSGPRRRNRGWCAGSGRSTSSPGSARALPVPPAELTVEVEPEIAAATAP